MALTRFGSDMKVIPTPSSAERMRELIHADVGGKLDLEALARETGLSRCFISWR